MAINKDELIDSLMKGTMTAARGPFPPSLGAFDPELAGYKYDPAKAKEMLASEKPESLKFDLYYKSSNENEDLMQMIKEDLAKIGVTVNLKKMEWAALKSEIVKGNLPAYYLNWSADFPDAHNFLIPLFHSKNMGAGGNRAFFSDAAADADMNKLESTSNPDEYKKLARKIQKDVVEKAPWIFMWHEIEYAASQKSVEGYDVPKIYSMENFVNVKLNR
jgi:peptide/nickel transport system substrate-binding protein/oligopeptide transport system substrate-binding protein